MIFGLAYMYYCSTVVNRTAGVKATHMPVPKAPRSAGVIMWSLPRRNWLTRNLSAFTLVLGMQAKCVAEK